MLVIEGMDNTGKTTLAKKIAKKFDLKIVKSTGPPKNIESLIKRINFSLQQLIGGDIFVYDRYPLISEYIYGPILRGKNLLSEKGVGLWKAFIKTQPLLIYCRPPIQVIKDYKERRQIEGIEERTEILVEAYDMFIHKINYKIEVFYYDYHKVSDKQILKKVSEYLDQFGGE